MDKRLSYIDWAKAICICLVCIGHFLPAGNAAKVMFYTFHVATFVFVGGLLTKRPGGVVDLLNRIYKLVLRILVPYTIWHTLSSLLFISRGERTWKDVLTTYFFIDGKTIWNDALWYVPVVFVTTVLFLIVCLLVRGSKIASLGFGLVSLGAFVWFCESKTTFVLFGHKNFLGGQNLFLFFGLIAVGYACKDVLRAIVGWKDKPYKNTLLYMSAAGFLALLALADKFNHENRISMLYMDFNDGFVFAVFAVLLSITLVTACGLLPENPVVRILSQNSLFIMCTHFFFVQWWIKDTNMSKGDETLLTRWGIALAIIVIYVAFCFAVRLIFKKVPRANRMLGLLGMQI